MDFVEATEQGKHGFWRYALGFVTILFFWLILGSLPLLAAMGWVQFDNDPATTIDPTTGVIRGIDPLLGGYLIPNFTFPIFLLGIFLTVRVVHQRRLRSLVTPAPAVDWRRVVQGFVVWGVLAGITSGFEILLHPAAFSWQSVPFTRYLIFLILAVILTPIQASTEELYFRGYLLQATARLVPTRWAPALINGFFFALPHVFNPEVSRGPVLLMLYYFALGAFFAWLTLRDGTAELVLGAHAANNLFVTLLINYEGSALQTPSLVMTKRFDPVYNLVSFAFMAVVFTVVVFHWRWNER
jgi:hypothetical protein